jgi:hypothetical protein
MACNPCASSEVVNVAFPLTSAAVPSEVVPSFSVTVPMGVPRRDWPNTDGLCEAQATELPALSTVCDSAAEVLA